MILHFSNLFVYIFITSFVIGYKFFFGKRLIANIVLDFLVGAVVLSVSSDYFESQIPNSSGQVSVLLYILNLIFFAILYVISTVTLFWSKSKVYSLLVPIVIYTSYIIYVFFFFEFDKIYRASVLYPILISFFPIYFYNYFKVLRNKK